MSLRDMMLEIGNHYSAEKRKDLTGNTLAAYIRHTAPKLTLKALALEYKGLIAAGSPGKGAWAEVPWLTVLYPVVTTSSTRGYYVGYLFSALSPVVYITLNQGATAVHKEFGGSRGNEVLKQRAKIINARVPEFSNQFNQTPIKLGTGKLAKGYEAGHAFGFEYKLSNLPSEEVLRNHLNLICKAYLALQFRGGVDLTSETDLSEEHDSNPQGATTVEEQRRYSMHFRIERNSSTARRAKRGKLPICQACGFNFEKVYGITGKDFIEAHHLRPLSSLNEGEVVEYDLKDDFSLLCSNCHRMIHRLEDPSDIDKLIRVIKTNADLVNSWE